MGLAKALGVVVRWWWFDGRYGWRRVALFSPFPALRRPRVDEEVRALDGGPLRHRACVLALWRRYALWERSCLWAARARACLVLLRCYALGKSLRASRCLRRLPLAVIGCDTPCFAKRARSAGTAAVGLRDGLAPRPRPFDATHRRVRRHGCPEARPLGFGLSVRVFRIAKLEGSTRGAPNTASPVWQVASTGLRPS